MPQMVSMTLPSTHFTTATGLCVRCGRWGLPPQIFSMQVLARESITRTRTVVTGSIRPKWREAERHSASLPISIVK